MASLTFLEELVDAVGSTDLADGMRVWFEQDLVAEEGFCNTMSYCRLEMAEKIMQRRKLITTLEGFDNHEGVALDCIVSLRNTQMIDLEKLRILSMLVTDSSRCIRQAEGNIADLDSCGGGVVQVDMGGGSGGGMKKRVLEEEEGE
ncbi:hypothetical protein Tco_0987770 [Tanacetum coccineum]